ncbi:hypothetical protein AAHH21_07360 [Stenotrophomonas sp. BSUC-16]|jgi:hypothetical protein|uniref:Uncharacterized protein n=1 Tax=Stenotrophomonas maltophilia TaxID=40324 RepID=A0A246IB39_STEMA|nr:MULTISPECIES: hypothetical protein [Stenotrophomonas]KOQ66751.1 hypothetical protein ABW42_04485 [Stenotrophomonas maltophilia]MBA0272198.1 hypothetical protein [Stenotrophomonas maltophilia]MCO5738019.1 hypothetical protein [Stenotrophomonas maltophilia]MCR1807184.1 hypothetical protein [Stenotrophomonas geniculata]MCZ7845975.1 hypothetical protein [Stenotrophomonas maltophilia]
MCAHAVRPPPDPILDAIRERLQQQYALHQRGARFWTAYQGLQLELVRDHPLDQERLCNAMADMAEDLGAVEHAQLIGNRHAGSTSR